MTKAIFVCSLILINTQFGMNLLDSEKERRFLEHLESNFYHDGKTNYELAQKELKTYWRIAKGISLIPYAKILTTYTADGSIFTPIAALFYIVGGVCLCYTWFGFQ